MDADGYANVVSCDAKCSILVDFRNIALRIITFWAHHEQSLTHSADMTSGAADPACSERVMKGLLEEVSRMSRRPVLQVTDSNADLAHGEISPGRGDGSRNAKGNRGSVPFASGVTYTPAADVHTTRAVMRLGSGDFAGGDGRCPAVGIPAPSAACSRGSDI